MDEENRIGVTTTAKGVRTFRLITPPPQKWEWSVFGGDLMIVKTPFDPPLWRRILTRIFLGSKWKRL